MRTLNLRLAAILFVSLLVFGGTIHFIHGFQVERHADAFLREAERAQNEGNRGAAIHFLQRYVLIAPENTEALADLGLLLAETRNLRPAYLTLEQVLRREPERVDVRRKLAEVAVEIGRYSDAIEHLGNHLLEDAPHDGELLILLGRCQAAQREYAKAAESFKAAIEHDPTQIAAYQYLTILLRDELDAPHEAEEYLDQLVAKNPESHLAHVIRGQSRLEHAHEKAVQEALGVTEGDAKQAHKEVLTHAIKDAERALELAPEDGAALMLATRCASEMGDVERAREFGQKGLKHFPNSSRFYAVLSQVALGAGESEEAIGWLRRGLDAVSGDADLLWSLANLLLETQKLPEAEEVLEQLKASEYPGPRVEFFAARLQVARGQWLKAVQGLESVRAALRTWPDLAKQADFWMGQCHRELGNSDQQLAAYRSAVKVDPFWVPARMGLAHALESLGRIDEALEEYRSIASLPDAPGSAPLNMARMMIFSNLGQSPEKRDWAAVEGLLDRIEQANPDQAVTAIFRAEILFAKGQKAEAAQLLTDVKERHPDDLGPWTALIALAQRERDWPRAETLLDEAENQLDDSPALRQTRARYLLQRHGDEAANMLKPLATPPGRYTENERVELASRFAPLFLSLRDFKTAEKLCQVVSKAQPYNLRIRLLLFDLAFRSQEIAGMKEILNEVRQIEGDGPFWRYGEAVRLSLLGQRDNAPKHFAQAEQHLVQAQSVRPLWSRIPLLMGDIHLLRKNEEAALRRYLEAIELGEQSPRVINIAVRLLYQQKDFVRADQLIRKLQEQQAPLSNELVQMAVQTSLRLEDGDFNRTLDLAQKAAQGSDRYQDYLLLGQVLGLLGQHAEAEEKLRHAISLAEEEPAPWVALIQFLGRTEQTGKASAEMKKAEQKIRGNEASLAIAQCYHSLGKREKAEEKYELALKNQPDDPVVVRSVANFYLTTGQVSKAEPLLKQIAAHQDQQQQNHRLWSRRSMALVLLSRGGYSNIKKAEDLIEQNLAEHTPGDETSEEHLRDLRAKAIVLASQPMREARREAISLFERLLKQSPGKTGLEDQDRFILAQLYYRERNSSQAGSQMRTLLAEHPDEPRYLRLYIRQLLRQDQPFEAQLWLARLKNVEPDARSTLQLEAECLFARKQFAALMTLIEGYAQMPEDPDEGDEGNAADEAATRIGWSSAFLLSLAQKARREPSHQEAAETLARSAEALINKYVEQVPENRLALAVVFIGQGQIDEALGLIQQELPQAKPEQIATVCGHLIAKSEVQTSQLRRAEQLVKIALMKHPDSLSLLLVQADLLSWLGQYPAAERAYRQVLAQRPQHVVALNNLAIIKGLAGSRNPAAIAMINQAIKIAGPQSALLDSRSMIRLKAGQPQKALADVRQAVNDSPESPSRHFHLAQALYENRQRDEARQALAKADEFGLSPDQLHPLERPALRQLRSALR